VPGADVTGEESAGTVQENPEGNGGGTVTGARAATRVRSAPAVLAAPLVSAAATVRRRSQRLWWLPGWAFAAVTQFPALLAVAWLVPGIGTLLAGRLLALPMLIIFVPLALALCYFAMRQAPVRWREPAVAQGAPSAAADGAVRRRAQVPALAVIATVAIAAGFAVWQAIYRSEQVIVVSDPGVYLQYGYWIAVHGSARIPASAAEFGAVPGLNFGSTGFLPSGGSITPGFMPGLPLVLAGGEWLAGLPGMLLMAPVIGGCAVLSFAGLVGRLAGARWAPAGALVLAVLLPEQYVSRAPFAEPLVQVLLFGGLCLLADSLVGGPGFGGRRRGAAPAMILAGLAGVALGLTVLVSIGSLSILLPAFPALAVMFVLRRPQSGPFGIGLFAGVALGLYAGLVLARPYLSSISAELHLFGLCAGGFGLVTALVAPLAFPGVRAWVRRVFVARPWGRLPSPGTVVKWAAVVVPVLVVAGFAARPYIQVTRGQTDPFVIRYVAGLQRLAHLTVDGRRQYYESSLDWVLWYLGIPAVLLAVAGAAALGWRWARAAAGEGRGDTEARTLARLWGLPIVIIGWSVVTVLWDPAELPDQPWASHRLVPVVLPGLILLGLWAASRLAVRAVEVGASRWTAVAAASCCVLAMAIPGALTSLSPGLAAHPSVGKNSSDLAKFVSRVQFPGTGTSATYGGSLEAVSGLCSAIGEDASVVFVDASTAESFSQVVRGVCGQPAASVAGASALAVSQVVGSISRVGRRPVLLGASRSQLAVYGAAIGTMPRLVLSLRTTGDAAVLTGPPSGTWPVSYTVWMATPAGTGSSGGGL
jgi:hypothetical protein